MKKLCLLLALLWSATAFGQTKVGLAQQATAPGSTGQLLYNNGGAVAAEDPIVSYAYVNIFNAVSATSQQTSAAVRNPTFGTNGSLYFTWASITGSPSGCSYQMKAGDSNGNFVNENNTVSVTPSNGTVQLLLLANSQFASAQVQIVYHCSVYPSTGTLTLDFVPAIPVSIVNQGNGTYQTNIQGVNGGAVIFPMADGSSNALTSNSTTYSAKFALDVNLLGTLGTAFGTAGVVDANTKQVGGSTYSLGSNTMANSQPIVQASDQGNPCFNPNASVSSIAGATSGTSLTQIIALVSGKKIFICSFTFTSVSGTTPTYGLEYGTGANCAGGTTVLVGAPSATFAASTVVSFPNAFIVPASNALCYKSGGTTPVMNYAAIYVQQ